MSSDCTEMSLHLKDDGFVEMMVVLKVKGTISMEKEGEREGY